MRLCRVSFAGPAVVLMAFSLSAATAHAQMGEAAPTYADQPLDYWQDLLARHVGKDSNADKEQCRRAAQALGRFGPGAKQAVPLLVQALQSPSTEVREFAVDALGRIGLEPQAVVPAIVAEADLPPEHINYRPLASFRRLAARALGRFGPEAAAAVPLLEKALQNEDPLYRVQAALALWKISQHPQAIPALRAALKRNESETAFEAVLAVAIPEKPEDFKIVQKDTEQMGFFELRDYVRKLRAEGFDATRYEADMHGKVAFSLVSPRSAAVTNLSGTYAPSFSRSVTRKGRSENFLT